MLEAEIRHRRDENGPNDPDDVKSYDPNLKTNHYSAKGRYTVQLVGQRRVSRRRRHTTSLTNMVESNLLGYINQSKLLNNWLYSINKLCD